MRFLNTFYLLLSYNLLLSEEKQPQKETASPEPQPETTPQKPAEVREETIDASANIINNFAKVFAEKQQEQAKQEAAKIQETVEAEIKKIQARNKKVELDKAWETSNTRKISIAVLTYFTMVLVMY